MTDSDARNTIHGGANDASRTEREGVRTAAVSGTPAGAGPKTVGDGEGPTGSGGRAFRSDSTGHATVHRVAKLVVFTVAIGAVIGLSAGLLFLALEGVQILSMGHSEDPSHPGPDGVPAWRIVASLAAAGVIAAVAWYFLRGRCRHVPSVAKAVRGDDMPPVPTVVHVLLQIFIVGAGVSVGRETAPRELGAMVGQKFGRRVRLDEHDMRLVVAAAAGAGFAGVYDSPFAGMFFAVEMLLVSAHWDVVAVSLGASCVSAFTAGFFRGRDAFYVLPAGVSFTPSLVVFAAVSAPLWGIVGGLFRRGNQWASARHARGSAILWMLPCAALLTATVAVAFPQVCGNGRAAAQLAFSASQTSESVGALVAVLLALAALKSALTLLTIRAGASGGVITPAIAIGACLAAALGLGWSCLFPADTVASCALMGAAAVLASSQQAPLMATCLIMELCHLPADLALPIGLCSVIATLVARWLMSRLPAVTELPTVVEMASRKHQ